MACFTVNELTHSGQPALLYLDPACVGSALALAAANGQLGEVWNFKEEGVLRGSGGGSFDVIDFASPPSRRTNV